MKRRYLIFTALIFLVSTNALAVFSGEAEQQNYTTQEIVDFTQQVKKSLAARGARVFIISRVGRPRSELPDGIEYSHTGFGVYSMIKTADGRTVPGYAMYNLYQSTENPAISKLVMDYPIDFFNGAYELTAGVIIPTPELQQRLLKVLSSDTYNKLHNPKYSAISNPQNSQFQNCTEHLLDIIQAAIYETDDIQTIKAANRDHFDGQTVNVGPVKMLLGAIFMSDVTLSDHEGKVKTATFGSIARYMEKYGLAQEVYTISPQGIL